MIDRNYDDAVNNYYSNLEDKVLTDFEDKVLFKGPYILSLLSIYLCFSIHIFFDLIKIFSLFFLVSILDMICICLNTLLYTCCVVFFFVDL